LSAALRAVARYPIAAFLAIAYATAFAAALTPGLDSEVLPFEPPLFGVVSSLGVALAAFIVIAAADGRAGVRDLARRTVRWRVPIRWYLIALFTVPVAATLAALAIYGAGALDAPDEGWPRALSRVAGLFVIQFVLFQFGEEVGWTGFFQDRLQDRHRPLAVCALVALAWAGWHMPDFFAEEGWTLETLIASPFFFVYEVFALFFARAIIMWLYDRTGRSVLLVIAFHASFDASVSELSRDIISGSDLTRLAIFTGIVVAWGAAIIVATRGRLVRSRVVA
jgi:uncharacterized protein